jgi:REP element-mobilizing transposase RayT
MPPIRKQHLRLPDYDYRRPGAYFITIVSARRRTIFGIIRGGQMHLSLEGAIASAIWSCIPAHCAGVRLDAMVVMPDHVHGILVLQSSRHSLSQVVGLFKAATTREINRKGLHPGGPIWQRSFYERVIRDDEEWLRVRRYIEDSPRRWEQRS